MRATFLGKDPESDIGGSPTLFVTDRAERRTHLLRGWLVTDPGALALAGPNPPGEGLIEVPDEVLDFYLRDRDRGAER